MATLYIKKTDSKLRFGYDLLNNYTYFGLQNDRVLNGNNYLVKNNQINVRQDSKPISVITMQLMQNIHWGIFHWDNVLTFQKNK